ncbi:MAG: family 10 glycosylhydrolase [Candidatus Dormibacteraeota bacterium]|nr:family 10 glycosylhydrolase [Candidatus Dormibacteraeota bacterium]
MSRSLALLVAAGSLFAAACGPDPVLVTRSLPGVAVVPASPSPEPEVRPGGPPEYRALWVDAFHEGFKNPRQVDQLISRAHRGHLNALFVQVRKQGDAYFRRGVEPMAEDIDLPQRPFDPLAYLIRRAHSANPPLEVHAWLNTFYVSKSSEVYQVHGSDWGNKTYAGDVGGFLDPGVPAVRDYTHEVFMQVVRNYRIDGIHMDFVRYPDGGDWGYSQVAVDRFNHATGHTGKPKPDDHGWEQWRRDQVTTFVRELHEDIARTWPRVKLSGALIAYGKGPESDEEWRSSRTYTEVYQDWARWFADGYLDLGLTMNYDRDSSPKQQGWFRAWTAWEKDHQGRGALVVGIGAFLNYPEDTIAQIRAAMEPTAKGRRPAGIAIYSYASTSLYGTDDFYLSPGDQGYLPRQPYAPSSDPKVLLERAKAFNEWFYTALSSPTTYQDPALGKVSTTPVFLGPAPLPPG